MVCELWAWCASSGHGVGLHRLFKYLLSCVETKHGWDWEMRVGSPPGAGSSCGCRRGKQGKDTRRSASVCVLVGGGWGDPCSPVVVPYLICAPSDSSNDCTLLALAATGSGLLHLVIRLL